MKRIMMVFFLLATQTCFGQACKTLAANKPSTMVRYPDVTVTGSKADFNTAAMKLHLDKAEKWIKSLLVNFTGAKLAYSNSYYFDHSSGYGNLFYNTTGINGYYYSQMRFFSYYCNQNSIATEGERGSSFMIYFN